MTIAKKMATFIEQSSWIRKIFEEGVMLRQKHGPENVHDFSLGNPNLEPPEKFKEVLRKIASDPSKGNHAYMPNMGYPHVRAAVADFLTREQGEQITANDVIMTCGAAGAMNVILKTLLDPGDEVLTPAPFFVEYTFYADTHGGVLKTVDTAPDFTLDLEAIKASITEKTKAVIINSPNNPTGQVYSQASLEGLSQILKEKGKAYNRTLYLISDEPYRKILFDNIELPSLFSIYENTIITTSYSKDLSIPGERIGFLAVNPKAQYHQALLEGMAMANRFLGFVNAPALMQRILPDLQGLSVDISHYTKNRDLLCEGLADAGYHFQKPSGAFYLFPQTPIPDDIQFAEALRKELVLVVPGAGFKCPGHIRIAFCVNSTTIQNALPIFKRVMDQFR